jgi:hypothetical protein
MTDSTVTVRLKYIMETADTYLLVLGLFNKTHSTTEVTVCVRC